MGVSTFMGTLGLVHAGLLSQGPPWLPYESDAAAAAAVTPIILAMAIHKPLMPVRARVASRSHRRHALRDCAKQLRLAACAYATPYVADVVETTLKGACRHRRRRCLSTRTSGCAA